MQRHADLASFAKAEGPRAHIGASWLHFSAHAELFGVVLWGRPSAEDTQALVRSLKLELVEGVAPHRSLVDASRIDGVDGGAFEALNAYVAGNAEPLSRAVTRLALVRPSGMAGAVTSGFFEVAGSPYPVGLFDDASDALAWLDEEPSLAGELASLVEEVTGTSALVSRLRAALAGQLQDATVGSAARSLGMSDRTLQRKLKAQSTTFAAELLAARLHEAQRLMRDTDAPLANIALDTGFSSQQHLSTAFRKATGERPSAWRARRG
jgi:AraC-like DNA-binding protein